MTRSRFLKLVKARSGVTTRFILSFGLQAILYPAVGLQSACSQNLRLVLAFAGHSLLANTFARRMVDAMAQPGNPWGWVNLWELASGTGGSARFLPGHNCNRGSRPGTGT
jgi:hypothetical protein